MLPNRDLGVCRVKIGLLTLRDCKEPAVAECARCGRGVCGLHQVLRPQFTYCPECAVGLEQTDQDRESGAVPPVPEAGGQTQDPRLEQVRQRQQYYRDHDYSPYYYGHHHYFSDSDYHTFGHKSHVVHHEPPEASGNTDEQPDGSFDDNLDDALES